MTVHGTREVDLLLGASGTYVRNPSVLWRRAADSVLLLRAGSSDVVVLDDSACLLWRLLDRPRPFEQIVGVLGEVYGTPGHAVAPDVAAALDRLTSLELVTHAAGALSCQDETA